VKRHRGEWTTYGMSKRPKRLLGTGMTLQSFESQNTFPTFRRFANHGQSGLPAMSLCSLGEAQQQGPTSKAFLAKRRKVTKRYM
jgi:hypothetical protein